MLLFIQVDAPQVCLIKMAPLKVLGALLGMGVLPSVLAKLVKFEANVTWAKGAPDGNLREMVFVNGQFPAPALTLDQWDDVEFTVNNMMHHNLTIHFHGIEQIGTPWSDGVPGLTQKPILPGETFTYKWTATDYGTYWYHSHARSLMADGLYGPIWINPAPHTPEPFHLISRNPRDVAAMRKADRNPKLITLSDWSHFTSEEYQKIMEETGIDLFCVDTILINGRGAVQCPGVDFINSLQTEYLKASIDYLPLTDKGCYPDIYKTQGDFYKDVSKLPPGLESGCIPTAGTHEVIEVDPRDEWASLKFISATWLKYLMASVDEHPMWIYEVDGHYIEPQLAHSFVIYNGERYSAMIKLDKKPKDYTIRIPDTNADQIIAGSATLRYKGGKTGVEESKPYVNYAGMNTSADVIALNESILAPYPNIPIQTAADQMINLTLGRRESSYEWTLEGEQLYDVMANYDDPLLYNVSARANLADKVTVATKNGTWVDLLIQIGLMPHTPPIQAPHVIHKHSNKAFIIGEGPGFFNWTSVEEAAAERPELFEFEKPRLRDTFLSLGLTGPAWMMVRYQVVNPGPFLIHCHIETHLFNGMGIALLDGIDQWPEVPPEYAI
ncbi:multicopper oxidase-domain-containing protein [Aspergillus avenaceus]|uniref:Multicopper oxidase-domain-containing protein n=1 Tax=Aspergillus avenaceus TaxID=36643 RepID=A0A5N6TVK6_ASPAV|nr:multicopper oxidase-domain-containing protein [Aspergillus avenaceus]